MSVSPVENEWVACSRPRLPYSCVYTFFTKHFESLIEKNGPKVINYHGYWAIFTSYWETNKFELVFILKFLNEILNTSCFISLFKLTYIHIYISNRITVFS